LQVPLRAAGWRFTAGQAEQVIAVDGSYDAGQGPDGKTAPVTFRGRGVGLTVTAPAADAVTYDPAAGRLTVRLPLPAAKGLAEYSIRLAPGAPPAPPAGGAGQ